MLTLDDHHVISSSSSSLQRKRWFSRSTSRSVLSLALGAKKKRLLNKNTAQCLGWHLMSVRLLLWASEVSHLSSVVKYVVRHKLFVSLILVKSALRSIIQYMWTELKHLKITNTIYLTLLILHATQNFWPGWGKKIWYGIMSFRYQNMFVFFICIA